MIWCHKEATGTNIFYLAEVIISYSTLKNYTLDFMPPLYYIIIYSYTLFLEKPKLNNAAFTY